MTILLQYDPENIVLFEGVENYTKIHLKNGKELMTSHTLLRYEEKVSGFVRVNRKYLVNRKYITAIRTKVPKPYVLVAGGKQIYIPRRKVKEYE